MGHANDASEKWRRKEHYRHQYTPDSYAEKKAFRHASNTLGFAGFAGHLVRTGGILAPLIIGEFIDDPDKKWKAIRLSAVAAAVVSEALYAYHHSKSNQACREDHAARDEEMEHRLRACCWRRYDGGNGGGPLMSHNYFPNTPRMTASALTR